MSSSSLGLPNLMNPRYHPARISRQVEFAALIFANRRQIGSARGR
jgi:hypothetical protein